MPTDDVNTYCTVYVHGPADKGELAGGVANIVAGRVDEWSIVAADRVELQPIESDDFDEGKVSDFPTGFYSFPYYLEVDFADGVTVTGAVETVSLLLQGLWDRGWAAVAVCGYADRLPHDSGVSEDLPWPTT